MAQPQSGPLQPAARSAVWRGLLLQTVVLGYSLIAGAFHSNPPSLAGETEGLVRLAVAVAAGMLALAARSRGLPVRELSPRALVLDLVAVYGGVFLSQALLGRLAPTLSLPGWAPTQGGYVGAMLFAATRALFAYSADADEPDPTSAGTSATEWATASHRNRTRYGIAGTAALAVSLAGLAAASGQLRTASSLVAIGSAYLLARLFLTRVPREEAPAAFCPSRSEETRKAAAMWYYAALLPASLVALWGSKIYPYWIPIVILLFAEANHRTRATASMGVAGKALHPDVK